MKRRSRSGFVLIATIVALVIIALLVTGAFFASGQDFAVSRAEIRDRQLFSYAEFAATHAIDNWSSVDRERMTIGETMSSAASVDFPLESKSFVTRLDSTVFWVVGQARLQTADAYNAQRRVGVLVTIRRGGAPVNPPVRVPEHAWSELY
jgi:hypothetical protein